MYKTCLLFVILWLGSAGFIIKAQEPKSPALRTLIFELSRSERTIWGIGLGSSIVVGHLIINGYYRAPADGPLPYPDLVIAEYIAADGVLQQIRDYGTAFFNVKWVFPVYKIIFGSVGLGLETKRKLEIYYVPGSTYRYGLLKSRQTGALLGGFSFRLARPLFLTCEFHNRLRSLVSLDLHWQLR